MVQKNAYAAYNNSKVLTATPAELTLMLYDGAIRFVNIGVAAIEKGEIENAHNNIMKAENIVISLQSSLDQKYPVSKDFNVVYTYLIRRLRDANLKKDTEILAEVLKHLRTMRDTWKEVMEKTANGTKTDDKVQVS